MRAERRLAHRMVVDYPVLVEAIAEPDLSLDAALAAVYERVRSAREHIGEKLRCTVRDLSANGAYIEGTPLPLLSRIALEFELPGHGSVRAIGWTLWRRRADCRVLGADGPVDLKAGFGVLFEALDLGVRGEIARRAASDPANASVRR